ncbi:thioredoxin family protein [Listeria cossartiae subsp. cayugensis]|uniref:Thioredoxin family protein n=1 Tax=Listeria cossartiae subsp. cayugensis TaxID=2713505 RepID=A0ABU2IN50_9LIST|nr:thioredoxin family protein [Listeria cossartiae]MDT0000228.1 thioredoxin family protein [Listeria cossartiae subsp. cayugensis]MDT0008684.1 thioredoxin family protein [Listeria cossartiae subsp. cayugensis]MDT0030516.1 thioredoxin family protein [Listeria cossartiae subsp. cayugensis]MDT0038374.1 thioredoxin family protein [Listeria cossartiae subsp. cayugensis]MDT0043725.1 thioredoxin family protein [Listeria cossartiae subsp. cayugensis]
MKKILLLLALIIVVLTLGACGDNKKETEEKASQTEKESSTFLNTISTKDFKQKMADKTTGFVYVGRPTCEDCQAFQPILKKELEKRQPDQKMAYYNTDKASEKSRDDMIALLKEMDIDSVPTMVYLKDGKVVSTYAATDEPEKLTKWMDKVSKEV